MTLSRDEIDLDVVREANKLHVSYAEVRLKYFAWFTTFNAALFYFYLQAPRPQASFLVAAAGILITAALEFMDSRASQVAGISVRVAREAEERLGLKNGLNITLDERKRRNRPYRILAKSLFAIPLLAWGIAIWLAVRGVSGYSFAKP